MAKIRKKIKAKFSSIQGNLTSIENHILDIFTMVENETNPNTGEPYHPEIMAECSATIEMLDLVRDTFKAFEGKF